MHKGNRRSIRLKEYDYTQEGLYFITINTYKKKYLFGKINNGEMILNNAGNIIKNELLKTEKIRNDVIINDYIIMPNHLHFIIEKTSNINKDNKGNTCCGEALIHHCDNNNINNINNINNVSNINKDKKIINGDINEKGLDKINKEGLNGGGNKGGGNKEGLNGGSNKGGLNKINKEGLNGGGNKKGLSPPNPYEIGFIIGQIKSISAKKIKKLIEIERIWHRNYYEHIIRNEYAHERIVKYIKNNPQKWKYKKF
jgi:REP element-mobilizing transposase RayT